MREIRRTGLLMGVEFGDPALTQRIVLRAVECGLMTEWFLFRDTAMRIAPAADDHPCRDRRVVRTSCSTCCAR